MDVELNEVESRAPHAADTNDINDSEDSLNKNRGANSELSDIDQVLSNNSHSSNCSL